MVGLNSFFPLHCIVNPLTFNNMLRILVTTPKLYQDRSILIQFNYPIIAIHTERKQDCDSRLNICTSLYDKWNKAANLPSYLFSKIYLCSFALKKPTTKSPQKVHLTQKAKLTNFLQEIVHICDNTRKREQKTIKAIDETEKTIAHWVGLQWKWPIGRSFTFTKADRFKAKIKAQLIFAPAYYQYRAAIYFEAAMCYSKHWQGWKCK